MRFAARLRYKGRWLTYCECLHEGRRVREAARRSGIDKTTAASVFEATYEA